MHENLYFLFSWKVGWSGSTGHCYMTAVAWRWLVPGPSRWGTPFLLLHSRPWLDFSWTLRADVMCHVSVHLCCCFSCSRKYFSEYNLSKGLSGFWRHLCLQSLIRSREHTVMEFHHASDSHTLLIQRGRWKINPFITLLSLRPFLTHGTHLREWGLFCFEEREAPGKCKKTWKCQGWGIFSPFHSITLGSCSSGIVLGEYQYQ